jgi:hypothetical protein
LGEIKVDWAALLPLGKIDVKDSPAVGGGLKEQQIRRF